MNGWTYLSALLLPAAGGVAAGEWAFGNGSNAALWCGGLGLAVGMGILYLICYAEHLEKVEAAGAEHERYRREMRRLKAEERARDQEIELERLRRGEPAEAPGRPPEGDAARQNGSYKTG